VGEKHVDFEKEQNTSIFCAIPVRYCQPINQQKFCRRQRGGNVSMSPLPSGYAPVRSLAKLQMAAGRCTESQQKSAPIDGLNK